MPEAIEISEKNIQEIRNSLGSCAFLVTAPRLKIVVDTKHGKESYSVGDLIDTDTILTNNQQEKVEPEEKQEEPQDMSHKIKVYCDGLNHNVHAVRLYHDNILMVREWCKEDVLSNAYIGDWVIKHNGHFGIMSDDAFRDIYKLWQPGKSFNDILKGTYERIGTNGRSFA